MVGMKTCLKCLTCMVINQNIFIFTFYYNILKMSLTCVCYLGNIITIFQKHKQFRRKCLKNVSIKRFWTKHYKNVKHEAYNVRFHMKRSF